MHNVDKGDQARKFQLKCHDVHAGGFGGKFDIPIYQIDIK